MIHLRTTFDVAPSGIASQRMLRLLRSTADSAPVADGVPRVIVLPFAALLDNLFFDLGRELLHHSREALARGPPRRRIS